MANDGGEEPPPPPEEPVNVDSPTPANDSAPADAASATATDTQSPEAVTTLFAQSPEDLFGKLLSALVQSYRDTGWSDQTLHLLRLSQSQQVLVQGTADPASIVKVVYALSGIPSSPASTQVSNDLANAAAAGLAVQGSPDDTSSAQNVADGGDPIDLFSGQLVVENDDLILDGAGIEYRFRRIYRSKVVYSGPLGANWSHCYNLWIAEVGETILLRETPDFREDVYTRHPSFGADGFNYWVPPDGTHSVIVRNGGSYTCRSPDGTKHQYEPHPNLERMHRLCRIEDRQGNYLAFYYDADALLSQIEVNSADRLVSFTTDGDGRIGAMADWIGRKFLYVYDDDGNLAGFAQPASASGESPFTSYEYATPPSEDAAAHNLVRIVDPEGQCYLENEIGSDRNALDFGRVVRQRIAAGQICLSYEVVVDDFDIDYTDVERPAIQVNLIERNGQVVHQVFNRFGNLLLREESVRTNTGLPTARRRFGYNADGAVVWTLSPEGRLQQFYFGRDEFLRRRGIDDAQASTDPTLTMDLRLSFGNLLASIRRFGRYALADLVEGPGGAWRLFTDALAAQAPDDIVQKWTYEPSYQQVLSRSDARFTGSADPNFAEAPSYASTLVRWDYTGPPDDPHRLLAAIRYPDATLPDGTVQAGAKETFDAYDANGRVLSHTDRKGVVRSYGYFGAADGILQGYLQSVKRSLGAQTTLSAFERDGLGRIVSVWGPTEAPSNSEDDVTRLTLDALDRIVKVRGPAPFQFVTTLFYDLNGMLVRMERDAKDESGNDLPDAPEVRTYAYDEELNVVRSTRGGADMSRHLVELYGYDSAGLHAVTRFPTGNQIRFSYNERGLLRAVIQADGTLEASPTSLRYDLDGMQVERVDALGNTTRTLRDNFGRIVLVEDGANGVTRMSYDKLGNVQLVRAFEQSSTECWLLSRTEFHYDERGQRVQAVVDFFDTPQLAHDTTDFAHSPGLSRGLTYAYFHTPSGALARVVDPLGDETSLEYGLFNTPSGLTDASGNSVANTYDAHGNLARQVAREVVQGPFGVQEEFFVTEWVYDTLDRVVANTDSLGNVSRRTYDSRGNLATATDPLGNSKSRAYDIFGRCMKLTVPMTATGLGGGAVTQVEEVQFGFDANGNLISLTDAMGRVTKQEFDALDLRRRIVYSNGSSVACEYDAAMQLAGSTDANGVRRTFRRDGAGRVVLVDVDASAAVRPIAGSTFERFDYDGLGRPKRAENSFARCDIEYNSVSLPTTETTTLTTSVAPADQVRISRTFDDAGYLNSFTYPDGRRIAMTRDALHRLLAIDLVAAGAVDPGGGLAPSNLVRFEYRGRRRSRIAMGNGASTQHAYDGSRRLIELSHDASGGGPFLRVRQLHDGAGNVRFRNDLTANGSIGSVYAYDAMYRLVGEFSSTTLPDFDPTTIAPAIEPPADLIPDAQATIDNIVGPFVAPGPAQTWGYDLAGNRTVERPSGSPNIEYTVNPLDEYVAIDGVERTYDANGNLATEGGRDYVYDSVHQLVGIVDAQGQELVRYEHDVLGRRVLELAGGVPSHFAYDGPNPIMEFREGKPFAQIVHEDRPDTPVLLSTDGSDFWYHVDPIGSVRALTDVTGTPAATYRYNAYGEAIEAAGTANRLRYIARPFDELLGGYDLRAREYLPSIGRFLQRDPRGMWDSTNLYAYAANDPVGYVDPFGLSRHASRSESPQAGLPERGAAALLSGLPSFVENLLWSIQSPFSRGKALHLLYENMRPNNPGFDREAWFSKTISELKTVGAATKNIPAVVKNAAKQITTKAAAKYADYEREILILFPPGTGSEKFEAARDALAGNTAYEEIGVKVSAGLAGPLGKLLNVLKPVGAVASAFQFHQDIKQGEWGSAVGSGTSFVAGATSTAVMGARFVPGGLRTLAFASPIVGEFAMLYTALSVVGDSVDWVHEAAINAGAETYPPPMGVPMDMGAPDSEPNP